MCALNESALAIGRGRPPPVGSTLCPVMSPGRVVRPGYSATEEFDKFVTPIAERLPAAAIAAGPIEAKLLVCLFLFHFPRSASPVLPALGFCPAFSAAFPLSCPRAVEASGAGNGKTCAPDGRVVPGAGLSEPADGGVDAPVPSRVEVSGGVAAGCAAAFDVAAPPLSRSAEIASSARRFMAPFLPSVPGWRSLIPSAPRPAGGAGAIKRMPR